jgi:hypothetical protein
MSVVTNTYLVAKCLHDHKKFTDVVLLKIVQKAVPPLLALSYRLLEIGPESLLIQKTQAVIRPVKLRAVKAPREKPNR